MHHRTASVPHNSRVPAESRQQAGAEAVTNVRQRKRTPVEVPKDRRSGYAVIDAQDMYHGPQRPTVSCRGLILPQLTGRFLPLPHNPPAFRAPQTGEQQQQQAGCSQNVEVQATLLCHTLMEASA